MLKTTYELNTSLKLARQKVPLGTFWKHYKGGTYRVTGHVICTDQGGVRVRYRRVAGPDFNRFLEADIEFVRPVEEWEPHRFTKIAG